MLNLPPSEDDGESLQSGIGFELRLQRLKYRRSSLRKKRNAELH